MKTLKLILVFCAILAAIVVVFFIIDAHKKTHGSSPQLYKCDRCTAVFNSPEELRNQVRTAPQYKCQECSAGANKVYWHTQELLERHMREVHPVNSEN